MLLLVFILVCGLHLSGVHHDSDSDGLGLVDWLAAIFLLAVLGLILTALFCRKSPDSSATETVRRVIFQAIAVDASAFRMMMPLRC